MLFHTPRFFIFLAAILFAFYTAPRSWRRPILLVASYYFYMCWIPKFVLLLLFLTVIDYVAARWIASTDAPRYRKVALIVSLSANLGLLGFFKYYNFFASNIALLLGRPADFPDALGDYLDRCHAAGQVRPTPLILKYEAGDYNCLHQDLYGEHVFPLQVAILLSEPGHDFEGGEFVLTEQRPRMQSRAEVVPLAQGDAVAFAVHHRPVQGTRGIYRVNLRHGVSRLRSGRRHTVGVIFHDAK